MIHVLWPALAVVAAVSVSALVAGRSGLPSPILLVAGGLVFAEIPGTPTVALEPDVVLQLVLPPLLYSAALNASLFDIRQNLRPILLLSVGLVVASAFAIGSVAYAVVPGVSFAAAIAFGAIVAPPDAVAAVSIGRRLGLPPQVLTLIEGESLLNDATALTVYQVALAAAVGGGFSLEDAAGRFGLAAVGGVAIGFVASLVVRALRGRLDNPLVENVLSIATPFLAYVPAEEAHSSGVLAVVVCGLFSGHYSPTVVSSAARLQSQSVWKLVDFLLEGLVFLLIGLSVPAVLRGLGRFAVGDLVGWAALVLLVAVVVRPVWVFPAAYLSRFLGARLRHREQPPLPWQAPAAISWAGMRGVVSLAAAFALPLTRDDGSPFPQRDLLLFLTFVVVVATLVLQGLSFPWVLRRLRLSPDRQERILQEAAAQQRAIGAGLRVLAELVEQDPPDDGVVHRLRAVAEARQNAAWERLGPSTATGETPSAAWTRLRRAMLAAERRELLAMRDGGLLGDEGYRQMERDLDFEESALSRED